MKRISILVATALLMPALPFAQSVGEKTGVNSTLGISPTTAPTSSRRSRSATYSNCNRASSPKNGETRLRTPSPPR